MTQRLIRNSKLTNRQLHALIDLFALEVTALNASRHLGINRHSAERVFGIIRCHLAAACERESPFGGEVEVDESYFGGYRKGQRGRGAANKVPVFGILKRNGRVYTRIVADVSRATLRQIIRTKVVPASTIYSDRFRSYDGLVLDGFRHYRINHDERFSQGKRYHINGIENFWGFAKTKLKRYSGISRSHFYRYLKEMEFRYNHRQEDLPALIRDILQKNSAILD